MGDPLEEGTDVGPQARHNLRDDLHKQVLASVERGATLLLGGEVPPGPGAYYPPTVLADVKPGMPAYDEELFGPVAAIIGAKDEEDAVRIANDTIFGLGAAVFTKDTERGERIARKLEAGSTFVNSSGRVRSAAAVWRHQGVRLWKRARQLRDQGVRERKDGVRQVIRQICRSQIRETPGLYLT